MELRCVQKTDANVLDALLHDLGPDFEVHADSSEFTFAAIVTGGANFTLSFECSFNGGGTWYEIDTSKTINADGEYVYYYSGKTSSSIRCRIDAISSGTPSVTPHIAVTFNG